VLQDSKYAFSIEKAVLSFM